MKIKVCIPHYFSFSKSKNNFDLPGGWIPGSARGTPDKRQQSFLNCLLSLINIGRVNNYTLLDIRNNKFYRLNNIFEKYDIDITVVTDGVNLCENVLDRCKNFISVEKIKLKNSKDLIFVAREILLKENNYDLYLYCEDDIGFVTEDYFDKILWFALQTNHKSVLMPHRFEDPHSPEVQKLYIDGPIDQNLLKKFMIPKMNALSLNYNDQKIIFNKPMNPHSATFCLTETQKNIINEHGIERRSDFVSSFESVCTLTPMEFFDIYKTDFNYRTFLEVEHHYTNYC